jgi:hypothetical protein
MGRRACCPVCENTFIVTQAHLMGKIVDCIECTKPKEVEPIAPEKKREISTFEKLLKERGL